MRAIFKVGAVPFGVLALCFCVLWASGCEKKQPPTSGEQSTAADGDGSPAPRREGKLPGAAPFSKDMHERLSDAWESRPAGYEPRTRHLRPDGSPLFTNRLFLESSPYLLQHAHNPVNWYPWGDEAFETAARLKRPVLLSVGYSTCHWCHVMEEESFEDLGIARYLNENYVAVKVDRERRPDVDSIYMAAVNAMTGRGGWPMTVWLTPERRPFHGGTYFPPHDGPRGTGFLTLLRELRKAYDGRPDRVADVAGRLTEAIERRLAARFPRTGLPNAQVLESAFDYYADRYDPRYGGLRGAPKFPSSLPIRFLLRYHRRTGNEHALDMATRTLEGMHGGGMYDHVGGGFHRYSTDQRWLVPHFEKMLYDNSLLAVAYLEAYQVTGSDEFAAVAREILQYLERDMRNPEGAFYSATDADSPTPSGEREEGYFFTWTPDELESVLGKKEASTIKKYYGVTPLGNFEGRTILNVPSSPDVTAEQMALSPAELREMIETAKARLYEARKARPAPLRDEKVLAGWNALAVSAFAQAALVLDEPRFAGTASRAMDFVLQRMSREGRLLRSYKDGRATHEAYLEDYAFAIAALLDLHEATGEGRWFAQAVALDDILFAEFEDREAGGYYFTSHGHERLLAREKPIEDGAVPSGNSVQVLNLLRLFELTYEKKYRERAEHALRAFGTVLERSPAAVSEMLLAVDFYLDEPKQIVIVTAENRSEAEPFLDRLRGVFLPNRVLAVGAEGAASNGDYGLGALFRNKVAGESEATAYVCLGFICKRPTRDPVIFEKQIRETKPLEKHEHDGGC